MFELIELVLQKRRYIIVGAFVLIDLLLMPLLTQTLQLQHANIAARLHANAGQQLQNTYDSPNILTNGLMQLTDNAGHDINAVEVKLLSMAVSVATGVTEFEHDAGRAAHMAIAFPAYSTGKGVAFVARAIGGGFAFAGRAIGHGFGSAGHVIGRDFEATGHAFGRVFGFFGAITHVSAVIRPKDNTPPPTITQLRLQQATLIQRGTVDVSVTRVPSGSGGACDVGDGNGGYPLAWCDSPMDSRATIPYSSDPINRECTSYAFWYFTSIEGHIGFRVSGNAKYWATTSNYPTHSVPAVGSIAVETAGAYGHVAIVQALPGQTYAGRPVPAGYVLVSEMNYDWNGHFRYSYSPLAKFSAYIYP